MKFKVGDKVKFTDYEGGGTIIAILPNSYYTIIADEGIEMNVHKNEIVALFNPFKTMPVFRKDGPISYSAPTEPKKQEEPNWDDVGKIKIKKEKTPLKDLGHELTSKKAEDLILQKYSEEKIRSDQEEWINPGKKTIKKVKKEEDVFNPKIPLKQVDFKAENKKKMPAIKENIPEIDLHLEDIQVESYRLSVDERLQFQLRIFQQKLESFIAMRVRKFVVIHGVGEGILRAEVRAILKSYPNIYYTDASWQKYGKGATMVEIRY